MPTEPQLLSDEALAEIEREPWMHTYGDDRVEAPLETRRVALTVGQRDALCQTARAAWGFNAELESLNRAAAKEVKRVRQEITDVDVERMTLRNENAALREQLAQQLDTLTSCDSVLSYIYHRERSRLLPATQEQVLDTMREVEKITRRKP